VKKTTTILAILAAALSACGPEESKCEPGEGAYLALSTMPDPPVAQPNGFHAIKIIATGQDDECEPIAAGTPIVFSLRDQDPEGVGFFPNDEAEITRSFGPMNADTEVKSRVAGTAQVHGFCQSYNLTALPVDVEFTTD
jgi:hypothetical protein